MNREISKIVTIFRSSPSLSDEGVFKAAVIGGADRRLAARLVQFLPSAYCRALLKNSGAKFSDSFLLIPERTGVPRLLSSDPAWAAVLQYVKEEIESGVSKEDLLAIAARSAEFQAANELLNRGSKLKDIAFTPLCLRWPEEGPT